MKVATKRALRAEIKRLRSVGERLACCAFNLAQDPREASEPRTTKILRELVRERDAIKRSK